jgi:1-aminocyclopropane-1-carboxylate deaminase/D-cysteine desulfhydrase-like pyridoxal-dependent ACC family enzyme
LRGLKSSIDFDSPLEEKHFEGIQIFLKRDDLIDRDFSGNKARKFAWFLDHDLPHIRHVVSYGSPQSNAMYSLSLLAKMRGWSFRYYCDHIASFLKENPHGNYRYALENGMEIVEGSLPQRFDPDTLLIEEGGRQEEAAYGVRMLAKQLQRDLPDEDIAIFLPSGTGTTAFFLQQFLPNPVFTTPCVGSKAYLRAQFAQLAKGRQMREPTILDLEKKYHFGKLYREFFKIWIELKNQTDVTFDLLYDPKGWLTILKHRKIFGDSVCYIHQGGLIGNESMLLRYQRKYG